MFASVNSPDLVRPWAIIITSAPSLPHFDDVKIPVMRIAICLTDEYAIMDFISNWRMQRIVVRVAPHRDRDIIRGVQGVSKIRGSIDLVRKTP